MLKQIIEYKEMRQLRKDHMMKQRMRYAFIFFAISIVLLIAMYAVETLTPAEPVKATDKAVVVDRQQMQERQEIEEFASIMTKPIDQLTSEEIDLMGVKAEDPCYEKHALLPEEEMVDAILACKHPK